MTGIATNAPNLTSLYEVFGHSSKLSKTGLTAPDIVDHILQRISVFFEDGVNDVTQVFRKGIVTLVCRRALRMMFATSRGSTSSVISTL